MLSLLYGIVAFASVVWIVRVGLAFRIRAAVPQLMDLPVSQATESIALPAVAIVVAARDEVATLEPATQTLLEMQYPALGVTLVDDRSDDGTAELADRIAAADSRVRAVHVDVLPDGWLGKVNALERGWRESDAPWVLFTDADVHFAPDALRRVVAWAEAEQLDHVCVLPNVSSGPFLMDVAVNGFAMSLAVAQRVWAVRDPDSSAYLGVGAFNLVRREQLERAGGFEWLRMEVADDLGLGLMLKRQGARTGVLGGRDAVWVRWYGSLSEMAVGLEKNLFATAGRCRLSRILPRAIGMVVLELAPFAVLAPGTPTWLSGLAWTAIVLGTAAAVGGAFWLGRPLLAALLQPLGTALLAILWLRAGWLGWRRGGVLWRRTFYPSDRLREGLRVLLP